MLAGVWQHHQIKDGTYTFEDLMDIHEMLDVKEANEQLYAEYIERQNNL